MGSDCCTSLSCDQHTSGVGCTVVQTRLKYLTCTKCHVNMLVRCHHGTNLLVRCHHGTNMLVRGVTTAPTCWYAVSPRHQHAGTRCHHSTNSSPPGMWTNTACHSRPVHNTYFAIYRHCSDITDHRMTPTTHTHTTHSRHIRMVTRGELHNHNCDMDDH